MNLRFEYKIGEHENQILKLLELSDKEFVPPLSSRESTTQNVFGGNAATDNAGINTYFETLKHQRFIIALKGDRVLGFLSYITKPSARFCEQNKLPRPCCYVTTIIVVKDERRTGIAGLLYEELFRKNRRRNIATRTWHDRNEEAKKNYHTSLLLGRFRFSECHRIENARGENIDTVYYCRRRMSLKDRLVAYKLMTKVNVLRILSIVTVIAVVLFYSVPGIRSNDIVAEIVKAIFTSLFVSILVMASEMIVSYKDAERDSFLYDISEFGISILNRDKRVAVERLLSNCRKELWFSGYRLKMTNNLRFEIGAAVKRGANGKALVCGPWTSSYRSVFGEPESATIDNYIKICAQILINLRTKGEFIIRFVDKPLFNDTYNIDGELVTGPYFHNKDKNGAPIYGKDFFSYTIKDRGSRLYKLVETEFYTLFDHEENVQELNWEYFRNAFFLPGEDELDVKGLNAMDTDEKTRLFQTCLQEKN